MSLRSTRENRHFHLSSTFIGDVEPEILMSRTPKKIRKSPLWRHRYIDAPEHRKRSENVYFGHINISASTPPTNIKLAPKCLLSRVRSNDIEFYLRGIQKKSENQNLLHVF